MYMARRQFFFEAHPRFCWRSGAPLLCGFHGKAKLKPPSFWGGVHVQEAFLLMDDSRHGASCIPAVAGVGPRYDLNQEML